MNHRFLTEITENTLSIDDVFKRANLHYVHREKRTDKLSNINTNVSRNNARNLCYVQHGSRTCNSLVTLSGSVIASLDDATILPYFNIVLDKSRCIVADKFGSQTTFPFAMKTYGTYFGYSVEKQQFSGPFQTSLSDLIKTNPIELAGDQTFFLLSNDINDRVYAHWMFHIMPILYEFSEILQSYRPIMLLGYPPTNNQIDIMTTLFPWTNDLQFLIIDRPVTVKRCTLATTPDEPLLFSDYINFLRGKAESENLHESNIYLSRSDAKTRRIINEEELTAALRKFNFSIVTIGTSSFVDQIKIFSEAKNVIIVNGSHYASMVFCQSSVKACVIQGNNESTLHAADALNTLGLSAHEFITDSCDASHDGDLKVNVKLLMESLVSNKLIQ
jgi:hypothetical protein